MVTAPVNDISKRDVVVRDSFFVKNTASIAGYSGGAIRVASCGNATLKITNTLFAFNKALQDKGGAVNVGSSCALELTDSLFVNNTAAGSGGALYLGSSLPSYINGSQFSLNSGGTGRIDSGGGAIRCYDSGLLTIANSTFDRNSGYNGGAVSAEECDYLLKGSTFNLNAALATGGGLHVKKGDGNVDGCKFTGNTAAAGGGAVHQSTGYGNITATSAAANSRPPVVRVSYGG